jgi:uncharacterized membrane protein
MRRLTLIILILICFMLVLNAQNSFQSKTISWLEKNRISPEGIVIIISALPVIELRGSIPVGMFLFHFSWYKAALLSIFGNMIPIPFILLFWFKLMNSIRKTKTGFKMTDWLYTRTKRKGKLIEKYKAAGLAIFVGIPLPGTGAWTGAFAAEIFGLKFWKSLFYIFLGVLMAAVAVTFLCEMGVIVLG